MAQHRLLTGLRAARKPELTGHTASDATLTLSLGETRHLWLKP